MSDYAFVTRWSFQAPVEAVWQLLSEPEDWPRWWPGVEKVELLERGSDGDVGTLRRFTWKSRLPYRLAFDMRTTLVDRPHRLEGRAEGELQGTGIWQLQADGDWTRVRYDWRVATTKAWMNLLAPLARPFFAWNHDIVMGWGAEGLARRLGCAVRLEPGE
ncbi:MAG: SRPBCC family protein [Acidobacteria bacterium]|nr:SRPBCC family protein [Acidobacteriota bacterium]